METDDDPGNIGSKIARWNFATPNTDFEERVTWFEGSR